MSNARCKRSPLKRELHDWETLIYNPVGSYDGTRIQACKNCDMVRIVWGCHREVYIKPEK